MMNLHIMRELWHRQSTGWEGWFQYPIFGLIPGWHYVYS